MKKIRIRNIFSTVAIFIAVSYFFVNLKKEINHE